MPDTPDLNAALNEALDEMHKNSEKVRALLVATTAADLIETAIRFAPGQEDFREAIHTSGPDGDHALIAVEDELARYFSRYPIAMNVMRDSREWDNEVRHDNASRAALATVNESIAKAEEVWPERLAATRAPAPR